MTRKPRTKADPLEHEIERVLNPVLQRDVVSTVHNFALELLHDCRCSHHQFRIVVHPPSGPADGRTVLLKPPRHLAPGYRQLPGGHEAGQSTNLHNCSPPEVGRAKS